MIPRPLLLSASAIAFLTFTTFVHAEAQKSARPDAIRVTCVGDSITYGSGVADREVNAYPAVLNKLLGDGYEVKNFGVSGATLLKNGDKPYWKQSAFKAATEFNPNVVIIKLGTNDTKPQNWKHKDEFAADLTAMVEHFAALPAKPKIWLCLPAPVVRTNYGINQAALDDGMVLIKQVAAEKKTGLIDIQTALAAHPEYLRDGVHPNAEGAALMAKTVSDALAGKDAAVPK